MTGGRQISFGPFTLDTANERLTKGTEEIALRPKVFAVLNYLLGHPRRLLTKAEILDAVWPEVSVGDAVLKSCIKELRDLLQDDSRAPGFIETVHRRGYRFIGAIISDQQTAHPAGSFEPRDRQTGVIVGRESELAIMKHWLDQALVGERQIGLISGEPGIGKTTLVEAFLRRNADQGTLIARGQCLEQYGDREAYLPVLEALSLLCRQPGGQPLIELIRWHAPMWLAQMPSLVEPKDREVLQKEIVGATPERMLREVAEAIEQLTARNPLVLVLEDLHWSDYSTLDLISYLGRRSAPARLLLIGTYRPVDLILSGHPLRSVKQELQAKKLCDELPLGYMTQVEVEQYLTDSLPNTQFPPGCASLLDQRTEGNPLFIVIVVDYLRAEGRIVEHCGVWQLMAGCTELLGGVPETIRQVIDRQIDHLAENERRLLEAASVAGVEF